MKAPCNDSNIEANFFFSDVSDCVVFYQHYFNYYDELSSLALRCFCTRMCVGVVAWLAWKLISGEKTSIGIAVISGALILGGLCFIVGFLSPMVFDKDTNQWLHLSFLAEH